MWQYVWAIGRKINFKQEANIKFCFKLGKTAAETHQMIQKVYGDECSSRPRVVIEFEAVKILSL